MSSAEDTNVDVLPPPSVVETHSGVVFFLGDRAYKLKKPVDLGFLDFRDRTVREAVCHREVELNRRLAPDVYLGVADVRDPSGAPCEHLVVMRRMPAGRRLSTLVASGIDVRDELLRIARLVATFHATAERGAAVDLAAGIDRVAERWVANTATLRRFERFVPVEEVEAVDRLARRYLAGRRKIFDQRIVAGRACDGHGDLLADDVFCLDDGPRILDCLEFDDALRHGDVLADVAFLAMDLERLGRQDLAKCFVAAYCEHAADTWPTSLEHHYIAYRAQVRSMVACIRASQGHQAAAGEAAHLLGMCRSHLEAGRVQLILVGGLPGTGKSTLAAGIGEALGAVVLRSDEVRKELSNYPTDQPAPAPFRTGLYAPASTTSTYDELLRRARLALDVGETVVLDASWTDESRRADARRLAADSHSDLVELRCTTPPEVALGRILARSEHGGDPSDADASIAAEMAFLDEPWPSATVIDSATAPREVLQSALVVVSAPLRSREDLRPWRLSKSSSTIRSWDR